MKRLGLTLLLLLASETAWSCSVADVSSQIQFAAITRASELSKQQLVLLDRFRAIGNRAKDPKKALNEQLSQADLAEFTQTQTRYQSIELLQLLESNYARDNRVIAEFFDIAQADYIGTPPPKEGDKSYLGYAALSLLMFASEDPSIQNNLVTVPAGQGCSMESALHEVEGESLVRLQSFPIAEANRELQAMRTRNGGEKIDRDRLNGSDKTIYDRIQRTAYAPANREKVFITHLESLKLLARAALLKYDLGKKDAIDSGGDINAVGKSVDALDTDDRTKMGLGMLMKIAEKFPSDWYLQHQRMAPAVEAVKKAMPSEEPRKSSL